MFRLGFHSLSRIPTHLLASPSLSTTQKSHGSSQKLALAPTAISKSLFTTSKVLLFSLPAVALSSTAAAAAPGVNAKEPDEEDDNIRRLASFDFEAGRHPEVQWAEQKDRIYLTVMCEDAKDAKVNIDRGGVFTFSGSYGAGSVCNWYKLKLDLVDKVDVEKSKVYIGEGKIFCILVKSEKKFWNKLLRGDGKPPHYVKCKWVDKDDHKAPADVDIGGMHVSKFGDVGGDSSDTGGGTIDIEGMIFDFGGFFEKGGKLMARYKYRKYFDMLREMGKPEDEGDFNVFTIDPDDDSKIYV